MSYALFFAGEFFIRGDTDTMERSVRPVSVYQAILSINEGTWREIARDVFGIPPDRLMPEAMLAKIMETNTCSNLDTPVEVWIDTEANHSILVYDQT
jgi:hypothetical protein